MDNRSQHYDWFKGKKQQKEEGGWKQGAKTSWKFTKIFLFFSIFFFSMWGCAQIFTNKTQTTIGNGTEIFASRDEVAPNIGKIDIKLTKKNNNVEDIYISQVKSNEYFNARQEPEKFKNMRDQYASKGLKYLDQEDAGGNALARMSVFNGETLDKSELLKDTNGNILVGSTFFNKDETAGLKPMKEADKQIVIDNLTYIKNHIQNYEKDFNIKTSKTNIKIGSQKLTSFKKYLNDIIAAGIGKSSEIKTWNIFYNTGIAVNVLKQKDVASFLAANKALTGTNLSNDDAILNKAKSVNDISDFIKGLIVNEVKIPKNKTNKVDTFTFTLNNKYFGQMGTGWNPIASWGQAFEMGRGSGPFYGIFVYPLSWLTSKIIEGMPFMKGWESFISIVLVVVIVSLIIFALSFKGTMQQTRMQELNAKKAVIEAKYSAYEGNKQMNNRKRQEVSDMYKKEGINPLSSMKIIFIQMPFFLAMWRTVGTNQHIKATTWLGMNFAQTSYKELLAGQFQYLPILLIAGGTNLLSQLYPKFLTRRRDKTRINVHQKAAMKKADRTQKIVMIVFTVMTLIFTAGLQVYFTIRSLWRVMETTITHNIIKHQKNQRIKLKIK